MPTDSELYTFNDFVSEEEVVSTNVISNCVEKNQVSKFFSPLLHHFGSECNTDAYGLHIIS